MPIAELAELVLLWSLVAGGICVWGIILRRLQSGQEIVAYEPRRPVPWRAIELYPVWLWVLLNLAMALFLPTPPPELNPSPQPPAPQAEWLNLAANIGVQAFMAGMMLFLMKAVSRGTWADAGLTTTRLKPDLRLGTLAFVALAPVVFGLQMLLVNLSQSRHPVSEVLEKHHDWTTIGLSVLTVVIVAPFVEEFLFRVALQGWLEKIFAGKEPADPSIKRNSTALAMIPVAISAAIFALLHLRFHDGKPDADPIPLFVLAVGLGYLYRQTHRIWPSVVVHMLLNACSLLIVLLQVFNPPAK